MKRKPCGPNAPPELLFSANRSISSGGKTQPAMRRHRSSNWTTCVQDGLRPVAVLLAAYWAKQASQRPSRQASQVSEPASMPKLCESTCCIVAVSQISTELSIGTPG